MAVADQETVFPHVGNGVTVDFPYGCQIHTASDLRVFANDVEVTSGFTVSGIGSPTGGAVSFSVAPANGVPIRIERVIKLERATDYQQTGDFLSTVVNRDFDRLWMALQQFEDVLGVQPGSIARALLLGRGDTIGAGAYLALQNRIQDLADPINLQDAANMRWVQGEIGKLLTDGTGQTVLNLLSSDTGSARIGAGAQVVSSVAALRALSKTSASKNAAVTGYYVAGDGGGGIYFCDVADTSTADNGGTVIVATDGGRWKLSQSFPVSVKQFGAKGDGIADDKAAFNRAIAYANGRTTVGTTISVPDGQYLISGAMDAITAQEVYFVGASATSAVLIAPSGVSLFSFGNGTSGLIVGGGARSLKIKYTGTPAADSIVFRFEYCSRLNFDDLLLENVRTLGYCGITSARFASALTFSNIRGYVNNGGNFALFDLRYGAGLFLSNNQVFVGGVLAPTHPAAMTTALNTNVINCITGNWDTIQAVNCIWERWDGGLVVIAGSGMVYQNFYFANCIWDYIKTNVIYLSSLTGGVVGTVECVNCWYVSWEGEAISVVGAGYNDNHSVHGKVIIAGKEAVNYGVAGAKCVKFDLEIGAVNRVTTTSQAAMNFSANSTGFIVSGCRGNDDNTAVGFSWRAPYGIKVGANCDNYEVTGNRLTGSAGGYSIATNSAGSANRRVFNNIAANYAGTYALAMPASGVRFTNTTPFVMDLDFFGGTITGGYDKNLVGYPGALQYVHMRLDPGDSFACGYSVAPTVKAFLAA